MVDIQSENETSNDPRPQDMASSESKDPLPWLIQNLLQKQQQEASEHRESKVPCEQTPTP